MKLNKTDFGIVQGRLSIPPNNELQWFPQETWEKEIHVASKIDFSFVEILVERNFNKDNPFWSKKGRKKMLDVHRDANINIFSICNDFIINNSLSKLSVQDKVVKFIELSAEINFKKIVLPLLEKSSLSSVTFKDYAAIIKKISKIARDFNIKICIESLVTGEELKNFIEEINMENVSVVFDTGNRVLERKDLENEIILLNDLIEHVHIKDKNINNENVLLGTGLVDFKKVFSAFEEINYLGPYIFETTRGNDPIATAKFHMGFCNFFIKNNALNKNDY